MADISERVEFVHSRLRKGFKYTSDREKYGDTDKWVSCLIDVQEGNTFEGDCEDMAITAIELLKEYREVEDKDLRLITCWVEPKPDGSRGGYHAVCGVDTEDDTLIIDNRFPQVMSAGTLIDKGYIFHKGMRCSEVGQWRLI